MADERCKKHVYAGSWAGHPCHRKPWKDGWCKQHHPESVAVRRQKVIDKVDAALARFAKQSCINEAERRVIGAAEKWRDSGNDSPTRRAVRDDLIRAVDTLREARR